MWNTSRFYKINIVTTKKNNISLLRYDAQHFTLTGYHITQHGVSCHTGLSRQNMVAYCHNEEDRASRFNAYILCEVRT